MTVHPSYLLRLPDEDAKAREYARFVDDLKIVAAFSRKHPHAALIWSSAVIPGWSARTRPGISKISRCATAHHSSVLRTAPE